MQYSKVINLFHRVNCQFWNFATLIDDEGSSSQSGVVRQVEVDVSDKKNGGSRMPFIERKVKLEFESNREIPRF